MPHRVAALVIVVLTAVACSSDAKPAATASSSAASSPSSSATPAVLHVLVSNDDGVGAPGIDALVNALTQEPATDVTVVAPATNQSGSGGKTTPGGVTATDSATLSDYPATAVNGFPADAVDYALSHVLTAPPDLVIAGVNAGQNVGPVIDLSGTVGAARAAAQHGVPALAVSAAFPDPFDFADAAKLAIQWVRDHRQAILTHSGATAMVDNLNVPTCTAGAIRGQVQVNVDASASGADALAPADCTSTAPQPATDVAALHAGFATLTPVPLQPAS